MRACRDELLSPRRHRHANQLGGAVRVRHRASDRGEARLLAVRLNGRSSPPTVIDSTTTCSPSTHRLAESPRVPTTSIGPSSHGAYGRTSPDPVRAGVGDGRRRGQHDRGGRQRAKREKLLLHVLPFDEVALGTHYPAGVMALGFWAAVAGLGMASPSCCG